MNMNKLQTLGWSPWFEERLEPYGDGSFIARVVTMDRGLLTLICETGYLQARLTGKLAHAPGTTPVDRPCIGDWVIVEKAEHDEIGTIHTLLPRRTFLRRKAIGESVEFQMIAANIDEVIVVQSCHFDFNIKRLERYLVMIRDGGAGATILLSKTDLVPESTLKEQIEAIRSAGIDATVMRLSNVTCEGLDEIKAELKPGHTYCFVGSSGVGKSTLINHLIGEDVQKTMQVSGSGEGRHTTVRRELIMLDNGALVIDNPGMREFGVHVTESDVGDSFPDIEALVSNCRFRDCTHTKEPGCAILDAIERGELDPDHYDNYLKLSQESDFNQLSYADKRNKDRNFGKMIKTAKKSSRKK